MDPEELNEPVDELERLADETLQDTDSDDEGRRTRGKQRRDRVLELYGQGAVQTDEDHYHAALVLLYGDDLAHFELARVLARRAAAMGESRAWSVTAAAWDRSLIARGEPQRFGTQFVRENGVLSLGPVDPTVTDSLRALYGVPPLWVQQQTLERLRRREEES